MFAHYLKLIERFGKIVHEHNFNSVVPKEVDGKMFYGWERVVSWKRDCIELVYPVHSEERPYLEVLLRVYLRSQDGREHLFDGINQRSLARRSGSYYAIFPLNALTFAWTKQQILGDLQQSLPWFMVYDTPQACLKCLQTGQTVLGNIVEGKASGRAQRWLQDLIAQ